jgi:hypothetical protein
LNILIETPSLELMSAPIDPHDKKGLVRGDRTLTLMMRYQGNEDKYRWADLTMGRSWEAMGNEERSLLSADTCDVRMICQTGAVRGSVLLITGIPMLLPTGTISSLKATASIAFLAAGAMLLITRALLLRREPAEGKAVMP